MGYSTIVCPAKPQKPLWFDWRLYCGNAIINAGFTIEGCVPELPEVETVVRALRPRLLGKRLGKVRHVGLPLRRPWRPQWNRSISGLMIQSIERRGKWIIFNLDQSDCLIVHLGMTGKLWVTSAEAPPETHTHLIITLMHKNEEIRYRDPRRFGSVILGKQTDQAFLLTKEPLGPEPWQLHHNAWAKRLQASTRCLKALLLDQQVVAGVGNIYADEALFAAKLSPMTIGQQLQLAQVKRLRSAIIRVLERAIAKHGSTIRNFYYGDSNRGSFQNEFRVYDRAGKPCTRCGQSICRVRLAGRSTYYCPVCQSDV